MSKKRVLIIGPVCNISGYSEHARTLADSFLEMQDEVDLYIQNTQWAASTRSLSYENKYKDFIDKTSELFKSKQDNQGRINVAGLFDVTYQVRPPNEFQKMSENDIGVTAALETTFAPSEWVSKCNMMKEILVVSEHARKNLKNTKDENGIGISTPVKVIPFGYDDSLEKIDIYKDLNITTKFNFLSVLQMAPRKNFENMLKWFVEEFEDNEDVGLVIKTHQQNNSTLDFHSCKARISKLLETFSPNKKCKVYFLHGNLTEQQMDSLYDTRYIDCYMTATHGEGFGIPIFNAACNSIPVIATNWSGHLDFLRAPVKNRAGKSKIKSHFLKTSYDIKKVQSHHLMPGLINDNCEWAYPKEESFKKNMRLAFNNKQSLVDDSENLSSHLRENYNLRAIREMYKEFHRERFTEEQSNEREIVYL
jgi:glycosyltransferase involved in cell wall biosynthesis